MTRAICNLVNHQAISNKLHAQKNLDKQELVLAATSTVHST